MESLGFKRPRMMTDAVAGYWTVVIETELEQLIDWEKGEGFTSKPEVKEIMEGYGDLVETGYREIFKIE